MTVYKEEGSRYSRSWVGRWCESQSKPYIKPLPYTMRQGAQSGYPDGGLEDIRNFVPLANGFGTNNGVAEASNRALNKLYDQLGQAESLRVAFAERKKSLEMVANRLGSLVRIARAVRRRDPRIVRAVLKRNPKAKDIVKQPAGLWLEYWFGWSPMISDIHHALSVFGFEFPSIPLRASSKETVVDHYNRNTTYDWIRWFEYTTFIKLGGEIYAIDPNVSLASRLGFGQPLSVAWELTPFSWCVDYVVNVSELAKNLEPQFPGIKVRNQFTTQFSKVHGYQGYRNREPPGEVPMNQMNGSYMRRSPGWPNYQLVFSNPLGLSGQRVSYLAAVFVQIISGMKKS